MDKLKLIDDTFKTPVLILMFNRADNVLQVINSLRDVRPEYVYISGDGARNDDELVLIEKARDDVLNSIDWDCTIKTNFNSTNLGCKVAVHSAIQWFFSQVEQGIVLEDDCVPNRLFYEYCETMLTAYKNDSRVGSISGRLQTGYEPSYSPNICSKRFFCWGWATWANRISNFSIDDHLVTEMQQYHNSSNSFAEKLYFRGTLGLLQTQQVNSWAYLYDWQFKKSNLFCILPTVNMIRNIGFGQNATHTISAKTDDVSVYDYFDLKSCSQKLSTPSESFATKCLMTEFGGWSKLILFALSAETKWLRKTYKKMKK